LVASLEGLRPVPGRFEVVSRPDEPTVVVDYAHTPEGISSAIVVAREILEGRVLAVFGAGGDRDRAKRPMMGRAGSAADVAIVTSDNPRSESPEDIVSQVLAGASAEARAVVDRREAIEAAIAESRSGDVVLILGKGHETGQEHRGVVTPFDDREVARAALNSWRKSANFEADSGSMGL
jgi:UDP-N-acetylmuramoyl-L-alanyl-D-glutamate--2,6-diaminopimelate ligase